MKILVTGATGFIGSYFLDYVISKGSVDVQIFGFFSSYKGPFDKQCTYHKVNLKDRDHVFQTVEKIAPDYVIHFAGMNFGTPEELFSNNVVGLVNLLDAILALDKKVPTLVIGSATEYGYQGDAPINESSALSPVGFYGISKAAATFTAMSYFMRFRFPVTVVRLFNVVGPGQSVNAICGKLVFQICEIHSNKREKIELTGGDAYRDFIDVRDVVPACWNLLIHEQFDQVISGKIFNLGSGEAHSVSEIIRLLEKITGRRYPVKFSSNDFPELVPIQISNNHRIQNTIQWEPQISLEQTLKDMVTKVFEVAK